MLTYDEEMHAIYLSLTDKYLAADMCCRLSLARHLSGISAILSRPDGSAASRAGARGNVAADGDPCVVHFLQPSSIDTCRCRQPIASETRHRSSSPVCPEWSEWLRPWRNSLHCNTPSGLAEQDPRQAGHAPPWLLRHGRSLRSCLLCLFVSYGRIGLASRGDP